MGGGGGHAPGLEVGTQDQELTRRRIVRWLAAEPPAHTITTHRQPARTSPTTRTATVNASHPMTRTRWSQRRGRAGGGSGSVYSGSVGSIGGVHEGEDGPVCILDAVPIGRRGSGVVRG